LMMGDLARHALRPSKLGRTAHRNPQAFNFVAGRQA
jgi:hypothetical protein